MPRAIIAPSLSASDFGRLTAECKRMIKGGAEWLHIDVMDGHFVPNLSIGPAVLSCVSKSVLGIFIDCHMLVVQPEKIDAGASVYCFHVDAASDAVSIIHAVHQRNMKRCCNFITDNIGTAADMLLVMTGPVLGHGGQKLIERCVPKIVELRAQFPDKNIEVDGGVGPKTIDICAEAAGTTIFGTPSPEDVIAQLKASVAAAQVKRTQAL